MAKKILAMVVMAITSMFIASCGGGGGGGTSGQGTLNVSLTDAPASDFTAINVTVSAVRVHTSADAGANDAGWHDLNLSTPKKINLLSLQNGVLFTLGQLPLPAGHYQQIRLLLVPNNGSTAPFNDSVVPASGPQAGVELPLDIRPEDETGIKIINQFTINAGEVADLILDFNGKNSVIVTGNGTYMLQPVVTATVKVSSGG
jgi:hypothetical protein